MKKFEQYSDMIARLYPENIKRDENGNIQTSSVQRTLSRTITFQVTDACNLACTYCYQINKSTRVMKFETAKKLIDMILTGDERLAGYVDVETSPAIIIEFIGGEPFLQVELIDQICDYFTDKAIELRHPWANNFAISICSNGVLYFDERVQRFLDKYRHKLSFSITIDGNKELHDACRIFPDGRPSYDLAVAGAKDWVARGNYMGSKITIAPENLEYLYDAILHMVELEYTEINANVVYENVWKPEHAPAFYKQLIKIADYFIDNDLVDDYYLALFSDIFFKPMDDTDNDNWCFKAGTKILTPEGNRNIEDLQIGDRVIAGNGSIQVVENLMSHTAEANETCSVFICGNELIDTTLDHPFLTKVTSDGGHSYSEPDWVNAGDLKEFDKVASLDENGNIIWKNVIVSQKLDKSYEVYNLTVSEEHTFIANGVIVHNCGGTGSMLSCDPDGWLYPCIRYMESSLGNDIEPIRIGHVDTGIAQCKEHCDRVDCLNCITRRSQSTDECYNCPIAKGCSWCSAYNYQETGTPNKRVTYICDMHKARSLANVYYWNTWYRKQGKKERFKMYCPKEWALEIISEEEYNNLIKISQED